MMFLNKKLRLVLQSAIAVVAIAAYAGATILYAGVNEVGLVYVSDPASTDNLLSLAVNLVFLEHRGLVSQESSESPMILFPR